MENHEPHLSEISATEVLSFGALILEMMSRLIFDVKVLKFWTAHRGRLEERIRKVITVPKIVKVGRERTTDEMFPACGVEKYAVKGSSHRGANTTREINLDDVKIIRLGEYDYTRHIRFDFRMLATLLENWNEVKSKLTRQDVKNVQVSKEFFLIENPDQGDSEEFCDIAASIDLDIVWSSVDGFVIETPEVTFQTCHSENDKFGFILVLEKG